MTAKQIEDHRCRAAREVIGAHHHIVKIEECVIQGRLERAKIVNPGRLSSAHPMPTSHSIRYAFDHCLTSGWRPPSAVGV